MLESAKVGRILLVLMGFLIILIAFFFSSLNHKPLFNLKLKYNVKSTRMTHSPFITGKYNYSINCESQEVNGKELLI